MRLTLGAARPLIAKALGVCDSNPKVPFYLNQAVERLLPRGKWKGTFQRYRTCINSACITLPRHFEAVEGFALCGCPGMIRNEFFEFQGTSYGILGEGDCPGNTLITRGLAVAFDEMSSRTQKIKVYADIDEDPDAYILLQGFDENSNWILTQLPDGTWIDGERVPLSTTFQITVNYFSSLTGVQKPVTNGNIRLYSYDIPSMANVNALAVYEPDETLPQYRRYLIPGLPDSPTNNECDNDCDLHTVDLLVKMAFIPVARDTDYLIIGNLQALKLCVQGILEEENGQYDNAMRLIEGAVTNEYGTPSRRGGAINLLEEELANFNGDGPVATPRMQDPALWGAGYIENFT